MRSEGQVATAVSGAMFRALFAALSPAGARARLSILIFHRVVPVPDLLAPDVPCATQFDQMMQWVAESFNVLQLGEATERLKRNSLPARPMVITFDDGYADNESIAMPILRSKGLSATFFVCSGFLDGGRMWNDDVIESIRAYPAPEIDLSMIGLGRMSLTDDARRRVAIERILNAVKHRPYEERARNVESLVARAGGRAGPALMMTRAQVRSLHANGMTVGGHTVTHPILTRIPATAARQEIQEGKAELESIVGQGIDAFAYPNGLPQRDYAPEHVGMVRACGFKIAVSTAWGVATRASDPMQLPRFTPWDRNPSRFRLRLAQNMARVHFAVA